nr:hypothetical protein [Tanacetum cinerariifolium]
MDDPNITMEEYIRLEEEKAHRRRKDTLTSEATLSCEPTIPQRIQAQYAVSKILNTPYTRLLYTKILEDIKRGPYSKKAQYAVSHMA